ncbi:MAG: hypothetical protein ACPGVS_08175, partial [Primorskyibacter sp.]
MYRSLTSVIAAALVAAGLTTGLATGASAQGRTLDLAFMPPDIDVGEICLRPNELLDPDLDIDGGDDELTDFQRIRFLRRDISRLQTQDPEQWFEFIEALIERRAQIDPEFAGIDELVAKIGLYIDAGRADQLRADMLVPRLRQRQAEMDSTQRLKLAQFYLNGIGVAPDVAFAQQLIVDAAFQGNSNALLQVAKFELEGRPVNNWDAPLDVTVSMAFGGLLG